VLDHLVRSVVCTTADDPGVSSSLVVLDGDGVLTHILKPYVLKGAVAVTVDTFGLVLADDRVLEGSSSSKNEDGVGLTWCSLEFVGMMMNDVE
jgi:hypothetical protein